MDIMGEMDNYYSCLYSILKHHVGSTILDIGCGEGSFITNMKNKKLIYGIDIEKSEIKKARKRFAKQKHIICTEGDFSDKKIVQKLKKRKFDTIISINVFEHLKNDRKAIKDVYDILDRGGTFLLVVPAFSKLYSRIDREVGHYRRYDKKELIKKLEKNNFEIQDVFYLKFLEAIGYFIVGKLLNRTLTPHSKGIMLYDKLIPIIWKIENIFRLPFGSSIVAIAKKR